MGESRRASMVLAVEAYVHRWIKTYERCVDLFLASSRFVKDTLVEKVCRWLCSMQGVRESAGWRLMSPENREVVENAGFTSKRGDFLDLQRVLASVH